MKYHLKLTMFQRKNMSGFIYFTIYAAGDTKMELIADYMEHCKSLATDDNEGYVPFDNELPFITNATENAELVNTCDRHAYQLKFYVENV